MLGLKIVPIIVIQFNLLINKMIILRQARGININIKLFVISLRETTAMTIESVLSRESNRGYL